MNDRFIRFLHGARWTCALVATAYHARFLLFAQHGAVQEPSALLAGFYFLSGLGHESYAAFFVVDGIAAGLVLRGRGASMLFARHAGRLFRVLLPGLLLGACLDWSGERYAGHAGVYTAYPELSSLTLTLAAFVGNALMLQPFVVPVFGSNSMLYLPSYLFWAGVLLLLYLRSGELASPWRRILRFGLVVAMLAALPASFLLWSAIWLIGVGTVFLCESRRWRPPLPLAALACAGALVVSRLSGPISASLPQALREWIVHGGFVAVGLGCAGIAWALYPARSGFAGTPAPPLPDRLDRLDGVDGVAGDAAAFTFFFHFPVVMLLASMGAAWWGQPLMRQPSPAAFAWLACLVGASVLIAFVVMGVMGALQRPRTGTIGALPARRSTDDGT